MRLFSKYEKSTNTSFSKMRQVKKINQMERKRQKRVQSILITQQLRQQ